VGHGSKRRGESRVEQDEPGDETRGSFGEQDRDHAAHRVADQHDRGVRDGLHEALQYADVRGHRRGALPGLAEPEPGKIEGEHPA
jgi:hypothetical protein